MEEEKNMSCILRETWKKWWKSRKMQKIRIVFKQ
nr:MAG TPA: hypothetical protein [Caudoviricetes sp.]